MQNNPLPPEHPSIDFEQYEWMEKWIEYSRDNNYPTPAEYLVKNCSKASCDDEGFRFRRHREDRQRTDSALTFDELTQGPALFYAGCGEDVSPALLFANSGAVSTIVYTDYDGSNNSAKNTMQAFEYPSQEECIDPSDRDGSTRFLCYEEENGIVLASKLGFDVSDFYPRESRFPPSDQIGIWRHFHVMGSRRTRREILFVYLWTEAIQTYYNLWSSRCEAPLAVVVQNHGKGGLWTALDGDCLFYAVATKLPEYLYVGDIGTRPWPHYAPITQARTDHSSMHKSKRVLFHCTHPLRLNTSSPLLQRDLKSDTIHSEKYSGLYKIRLLPQEKQPDPANA